MEDKKKSPEETARIFKAMTKASVKGNPKPKEKGPKKEPEKKG